MKNSQVAGFNSWYKKNKLNENEEYNTLENMRTPYNEATSAAVLIFAVRKGIKDGIYNDTEMKIIDSALLNITGGRTYTGVHCPLCEDDPCQCGYRDDMDDRHIDHEAEDRMYNGEDEDDNSLDNHFKGSTPDDFNF